MNRMAMFLNLLAYSAVVGQPLFYLLALTQAQRALSGSAYVELRQRINAVMSRRVPLIYLTTLVTSSSLLALSWRAGDRMVLTTTLLAFVCLVVDVVLMMRENVPINTVIDRWSPIDPPEDWHAYREKWFAIFGYRQIILLVGFIGLLFGAVFHG